MKRFLLLGALALGGVAAVVAVPTLAQLKEEARRNWRDLPQSQRALRVPTSERLNQLFPGGARQVLEESPQLTLFSVDPSPEDYDAPMNSKATPMFHGHRILGQTVVADPAAKAALLASLYDGFVPAPRTDGLKQIGLGCFNPRHGIRAKSDGKTVDLLICFECMNFQSYLDGHQLAANRFVSEAPLPKFNEILTAAGVPLSPE